MPELLISFWILLCAAAVGSFLNVVITRLPIMERGGGADYNLFVPGSRCPHCGTAIALRHNIPIVGWLWLRGRAACCGRPILLRYFLVEVVFTAGCLFIWLLLAPALFPALAAMSLFACLLAILILYRECEACPLSLLVFTAALGLIICAVFSSVPERAMRAVVMASVLGAVAAVLLRRRRNTAQLGALGAALLSALFAGFAIWQAVK